MGRIPRPAWRSKFTTSEVDAHPINVGGQIYSLKFEAEASLTEIGVDAAIAVDLTERRVEVKLVVVEVELEVEATRIELIVETTLSEPGIGPPSSWSD